MRNHYHVLLLILGTCQPLVLSCQTPQQTYAAGVVGTTLLGGSMPTQEIEQIYYLGVFDPQEQTPQAVYRITVRGQASLLSLMRFGSGWVRADLIDSLNTHVGFDPDGRVEVSKGGGEPMSSLKPGRRLVLFGPEGFREAPKDHRLVMVMGSSPEAFFQAVDESLEVISQVSRDQYNAGVSHELIREGAELKLERQRLHDLELDLARDSSDGGEIR